MEKQNVSPYAIQIGQRAKGDGDMQQFQKNFFFFFLGKIMIHQLSISKSLSRFQRKTPVECQFFRIFLFPFSENKTMHPSIILGLSVAQMRTHYHLRCLANTKQRHKDTKCCIDIFIIIIIHFRYLLTQDSGHTCTMGSSYLLRIDFFFF